MDYEKMWNDLQYKIQSSMEDNDLYRDDIPNSVLGDVLVWMDHLERGKLNER